MTNTIPITFPITAPAAAALLRANTFFLSADRKNVFSLRRTSASDVRDVRDFRVAAEARRCSEALLVCPADAAPRGW